MHAESMQKPRRMQLELFGRRELHMPNRLHRQRVRNKNGPAGRTMPTQPMPKQRRLPIDQLERLHVHVRL